MRTESQEFKKLEEEAKIQVDLEQKNNLSLNGVKAHLLGSENIKLEDNVSPRILNADIES